MSNLLIGTIGVIIVITFVTIIAANNLQAIRTNQEANSTVYNYTDSVLTLTGDVGDLFPHVIGVITAIIVIIVIASLFIILLNSWRR